MFCPSRPARYFLLFFLALADLAGFFFADFFVALALLAAAPDDFLPENILLQPAEKALVEPVLSTVIVGAPW
ncbi:MAG: hypothetical protein C0483_06360 [Pirellula sp.]|nr:hypothetical protein [Pirellula sp.]